MNPLETITSNIVQEQILSAFIPEPLIGRDLNEVTASKKRLGDPCT